MDFSSKALSIIDTTINGLQVYVDNNAQKIRVNGQFDIRNASISLYTIQGRLILKSNLKTNHTSIDVSNLNTGIYIIKTISGNKTNFEKNSDPIIIQTNFNSNKYNSSLFGKY